MMPTLSEVFVRSERIVGRKLAQEYVLVPIVGHGADVDSIFNLNAVGALIWEKLDGKNSGQDVVDAIVERFDVTAACAAADYAEFVEKLVSINAVQRVDSPAGRK